MLVLTSWCLHLNSNWKFVYNSDRLLITPLHHHPHRRLHQVASLLSHWPQQCWAGPDLYTSYCQIKLLYFWLNHFDWITGSCSLTGIASVHQHCRALLSSPRINVIAQTSCLTTIALPQPAQARFQVSISTIFRSDKISWENTFTPS